MFLIYGRPGCRWCVSATRAAFDAGVTYQYRDYLTNPEWHSFIVSEGHTTVPQIYHLSDNEVLTHIGGFEDFKAYLDDTNKKTDVPENGK